MRLGAFDCINLIGRGLFDKKRVLTEPDVIRKGVGCRRGLKVNPLYIKNHASRNRWPPTKSNTRYSYAVGITRERLALRDFNNTRIISYDRNDWLYELS